MDITSFEFIPGVNLDDSRFTVAEINAAEAVVRQAIQDRASSLNLSKNSTLYDVQVRQQAIVYLLNRAMNEALAATQSLLGVIENPELVNNEVIDEILSNVLITRRAGSKTTGRIRVNVSSETIFLISPDMVFTTVTGLSFSPSASYRALSTPTEDLDLRLYSADSDNSSFYFLVPVESAVSGLANRLLDGTELSLSASLPFLISCTAFGDFQGGADDESNEELIKRIPEGQSAKNHVSRVSISASLKEAFPEVRSVSVQGMNDLAMTRNVNILNMRTGGCADVYVRTTLGMEFGSTDKTATLVDIGEDNNATYSVVLSRDDFPGFYFTRSVRPTEVSLTGTYQITSETRSFNATVVDEATGRILRPNRINTTQEATYSRYHLTEVFFLVEYDADLGSLPADQFAENIPITVEVAYAPLISEIQDFLLDRSRGVVLADYLVRGLIPCLVEISPLRVEASSEVSADTIRQAIFSHVNGLEPEEQIRVDSIIKIIRGIGGVQAVNLPIRLTGNIYAPNGSILRIVGDNTLSIPSRPDLQVLPETVAFFIELSDIPVALVTV